MKPLDLDGFTGEFYRIFKEEITLISHNFFQNIKEDNILPNSFYESKITLILKSDKNSTNKN